MDQCDTKIDLVGQWPIFYDPVILLDILILPCVLKVADLNCFEILSDGACQEYLCPSGHLL